MGLATGLVSDYVLPLFLKNVGVSTEIIGIVLGINLLVSGTFMYFFTGRLKPKKLILIGGAFYSLIIILLGFSGLVMVIILMMFLGVADGFMYAGQETIFVKITDHRSYGGDIGLLMVGPHLGKMISQALSGFIIASYGFYLLFFAAGAVFLIYSLSAYKTLK